MLALLCLALLCLLDCSWQCVCVCWLSSHFAWFGVAIVLFGSVCLACLPWCLVQSRWFLSVDLLAWAKVPKAARVSKSEGQIWTTPATVPRFKCRCSLLSQEIVGSNSLDPGLVFRSQAEGRPCHEPCKGGLIAHTKRPATTKGQNITPAKKSRVVIGAADIPLIPAFGFKDTFTPGFAGAQEADCRRHLKRWAPSWPRKPCSHERGHARARGQGVRVCFSDPKTEYPKL